MRHYAQGITCHVHQNAFRYEYLTKTCLSSRGFLSHSHSWGVAASRVGWAAKQHPGGSILQHWHSRHAGKNDTRCHIQISKSRKGHLLLVSLLVGKLYPRRSVQNTPTSHCPGSDDLQKLKPTSVKRNETANIVLGQSQWFSFLEHTEHTLLKQNWALQVEKKRRAGKWQSGR